MPAREVAARSTLFASLATLAAHGVGILKTRVELLALELEEERRHFLTVLVLILLGVLCMALALALLSAALVLASPVPQRLPVLCALVAAYAIVAVGIGMHTARRMRDKAAPFAASLAELRKDGEQLGGGP